MNLEASLLNLLPKFDPQFQQKRAIPTHSQISHLPLLVVSFRIPPPADTEIWSTGCEGGVAAMLSALKDVFRPTWLTLGKVGIQLRDDSKHEDLITIQHISASTMMTHYMVSNEVIWPIFHDLSLPFLRTIGEFEWSEYLAVNRAMANTIIDLRDGNSILINDYQFAMIPQFLRDNDLGSTTFLFHCSFPSFEGISRFPWMKELIRSVSLCGAIGFQTTDDLIRFRHCQSQCNLQESEKDSLFVCPSTIDFLRWEQKVDKLNTQAFRSSMQELFQAEHILLAVDRIDPVKGIDLKLKAFELGLYQEDGATNFALIQIASPSRDRLTLYQRTTKQIEYQVASINTRHGNHVHLIKRLLSQEALAILYRACDGLVVTSRREGMNLVAQEFIACRPSEPGALLLSENTGLACRIPQLGSIDPYNAERLALRMCTIGKSPTPLEEWNLGVNLLRKSSSIEWARKVGDAIAGTT